MQTVLSLCTYLSERVFAGLHSSNSLPWPPPFFLLLHCSLYFYSFEDAPVRPGEGRRNRKATPCRRLDFLQKNKNKNKNKNSEKKTKARSFGPADSSRATTLRSEKIHLYSELTILGNHFVVFWMRSGLRGRWRPVCVSIGTVSKCLSFSGIWGCILFLVFLFRPSKERQEASRFPLGRNDERTETAITTTAESALAPASDHPVPIIGRNKDRGVSSSGTVHVSSSGRFQATHWNGTGHNLSAASVRAPLDGQKKNQKKKNK